MRTRLVFARLPATTVAGERVELGELVIGAAVMGTVMTARPAEDGRDAKCTIELDEPFDTEASG